MIYKLIILGLWAFFGTIQWLRYNGDVRRQPQIFVFCVICGPLIWICHCFGWTMDFLHRITLGFREWLFKP